MDMYGHETMCIRNAAGGPPSKRSNRRRCSSCRLRVMTCQTSRSRDVSICTAIVRELGPKFQPVNFLRGRTRTPQAVFRMAVRPITQQFYVQPILNDIFNDEELRELGSPDRMGFLHSRCIGCKQTDASRGYCRSHVSALPLNNRTAARSQSFISVRLIYGSRCGPAKSRKDRLYQSHTGLVICWK
jgi:hypothetical protein